ncbi:MAG: multicopper oxidase domain-containing protein [Acidimicrobiales bacterium]
MDTAPPSNDLPAPAPAPTEEPSARDGMFAIAIVVALLALVGAMLAVGMGWRAIDESSASATGGAGAGGGQAMVSLSEFKLSAASVSAGGSLHVMNEGTAAHNLSIDGTDLKTPDLAAGKDAVLELGDLAPGTYTMFCAIPGHREAGMQAELTVTEGAAPASGGAGGAAAAGGGAMDYDAMTAAMLNSMAKFPAATEGTGNGNLEPTEVLADGTKVFDLVAAITKWERSPGDVVEAWTYNGTVPAPSIHLQVGDKAQLRLTNKLPIATDLHLHGLNVDNKFDGVAPISQPVIKPGETFTYEYTADEVAVAMYHPHFHSQLGMPNGMFGTIFVGQVLIPRGRTVGGEAIPADLKVTQEIPMVLNDSGVIGFSLNGKSFPATAPIVAKTGDWVLVTYFNEGSQAHPMHLHQFDQIVLAKDGYPLDSPYVADVINVAPGERYSVLVKLDKAGTWVWHCHILPHVENDKGMFGMVTAVVVK